MTMLSSNRNLHCVGSNILYTSQNMQMIGQSQRAMLGHLSVSVSVSVRVRCRIQNWNKQWFCRTDYTWENSSDSFSVEAFLFSYRGVCMNLSVNNSCGETILNRFSCSFCHIYPWSGKKSITIGNISRLLDNMKQRYLFRIQIFIRKDPLYWK